MISRPAAKQAETNEPTASVPKVGVTPAEFAKAYKSFAAHSDDKFNQHIKAAEGFMKWGDSTGRGRFPRFGYKPNDR
jgi:hypothetical protein